MYDRGETWNMNNGLRLTGGAVLGTIFIAVAVVLLWLVKLASIAAGIYIVGWLVLTWFGVIDVPFLPWNN